jgi:hypothetical protein
MFQRPLLTTTISESVALGPDDAVAALDVHRFEGVVAGLWAVRVPGIRLTFIGIPTRRPYLPDHDALTVAVRVAAGRRELVGEIALIPWADRATEVTLSIDAAAGRRLVRWFDRHVDDLRPLVRALGDGLADAAGRVDPAHDPFFDCFADSLAA